MCGLREQVQSLPQHRILEPVAHKAGDVLCAGADHRDVANLLGLYARLSRDKTFEVLARNLEGLLPSTNV